MHAIAWKGWAENWNKSTGDMIAEFRSQLPGTVVRDPVAYRNGIRRNHHDGVEAGLQTLGSDRSASDVVLDFIKARVCLHHSSRSCLRIESDPETSKLL
jgi:hypothetical protein